MHRFPLAILLLCLFSCNQVTKNETNNVDSNIVVDTPIKAPAQEQKQTLDPIVYIRERVTHINEASLETKHFEFMCDELTKVDFFYEKGEIVKIKIDFGTVGDVYAKEDYYYDKGKLIFFYEFVEGGPACEGCIKTNEYRSYIKNDQVFKYLKDQQVQKCRKCEFGPKSRQYLLLNAKTEQEVKAIVCR